METRGFAGLLGDPHPGQQITGRPKRDVQDGPGRQRLQTWGRLASAFRPTGQVDVLRRSLRQRAMWLTSASHPMQQRPKALTPMTIKLQHVVSAVTGATGIASRRAMLAGARDPVQVARLRHDRCYHDAATMAKALPGPGREEPLFAVAQAVALDDR